MTDIDFSTVKKIKESYEERPLSKLDELRALNKRAKRPAEIFAYIFGSLGALTLGIGMCLAMEIIGSMMPLGIAVGALGIAAVSFNFPIYRKLLARSRAKYRDEILELSDEIMNSENN